MYLVLLTSYLHHHTQAKSDSGEKVALKLSVPEAKIMSSSITEEEDEMEEERLHRCVCFNLYYVYF